MWWVIVKSQSWANVSGNGFFFSDKKNPKPNQNKDLKNLLKENSKEEKEKREIWNYMLNANY